jgi:hypothetical protein
MPAFEEVREDRRCDPISPPEFASTLDTLDALMKSSRTARSFSRTD